MQVIPSNCTVTFDCPRRAYLPKVLRNKKEGKDASLPRLLHYSTWVHIPGTAPFSWSEDTDIKWRRF